MRLFESIKDFCDNTNSNSKKLFADMLLLSAKANYHVSMMNDNDNELNFCRCFTNVSNINVYNTLDDSCVIIEVYTDFFDNTNEISTASFYFRISTSMSYIEHYNFSHYDVEYLNALDMH